MAEEMAKRIQPVVMMAICLQECVHRIRGRDSRGNRQFIAAFVAND